MSPGLENLKQILGDDYFAKRQQSTNSFNRDIRQLSEDYAFGNVWARPGLPRKTRSMLVLAMLTAMGRNEELRMHTVGALNNGCSVDEIKEVLLQTAIYCGVPAAIEAFKHVEQTLGEIGALKEARD